MALLKVVWDKGFRDFQKRMRTAEKRLDKELRLQIRAAAKVVRGHVKSRFQAAYPGGTGFTARKVAFSAKVRRRPRLTAYGWIGWRWAKATANRPTKTPGVWHVPMAYTGLLDRGGTVHRKISRFIGGQSGRRVRDRTGIVTREAKATRVGAGRRRAHTAKYKGRRFFDPAVNASQAEVFKILGKVVKVI